MTRDTRAWLEAIGGHLVEDGQGQYRLRTATDSQGRQGGKGKPVESEARFQASLTELATIKGWTLYHTFDSRRSVPGYPDIELARVEPQPRIIKAELKRIGQRPTVAQCHWLHLYAQIGQPIEPYLWTPAHWHWIVRILEPAFRLEELSDADARLCGLWHGDAERDALPRVQSDQRAQARHANRARV